MIFFTGILTPCLHYAFLMSNCESEIVQVVLCRGASSTRRQIGILRCRSTLRHGNAAYCTMTLPVVSVACLKLNSSNNYSLSSQSIAAVRTAEGCTVGIRGDGCDAPPWTPSPQDPEHRTAVVCGLESVWHLGVLETETGALGRSVFSTGHPRGR